MQPEVFQMGKYLLNDDADCSGKQIYDHIGKLSLTSQQAGNIFTNSPV